MAYRPLRGRPAGHRAVHVAAVGRPHRRRPEGAAVGRGGAREGHVRGAAGHSRDEVLRVGGIRRDPSRADPRGGDHALPQVHYLQITNTMLLFLTPVLLGGLVMAIYVGVNGAVTVTDAYTIINVVNITRLAVNMFPLVVASLSQASVTYRRMDAYLASDEVKRPSALTHDDDDVVSESPASAPISVRNAHFKWSAKPTIAPDVVVLSDAIADEQQDHSAQAHELSLEGVNLEIDAGSLVMIVGTEAWIRNGSVKDNILFEEKLDDEKYAAVLEATQLSLDLDALPHGDQAEIGERGINLSGGQKARVAIARAVYHSSYDILILDDPLSAVDPHVAHAIFSRCIMGLARDKTRLLVLNSHYDLLQHADKIIVLQDGRIAGDGTYTDTLAQFPELRSIGDTLDKLERDMVDEHEHEEEEEEAAATASIAPATVTPLLRTAQGTINLWRSTIEIDDNWIHCVAYLPVDPLSTTFFASFADYQRWSES
ncbi:hypothetical protein PHYPSEUDO_012417 [Phytophthora pseudosyringae]|uniref:ABC transporter domain-containing protein n=1 Tax=Phytophthora pseudosyringae TaxID=221518 RepID=A0A8T1WFZ4_9STRA|nr:hypothetical protein PHYPSEUDO_012417 [Phytophthora pseudosyringae]